MVDLPSDCEVLIVGAGVAGASAAYHLAKSGVKNIVVLDRGKAGFGSVPLNNPLDFDKCSGTAVMTSCSTIKMILQLFTGNWEEFCAHHGTQGAQKYLGAAKIGANTQKAIATEVMPDLNQNYRQLGFLYIAYEEDMTKLRNEFDKLTASGSVTIEWWDREKLNTTPGCPAQFHCAIYFPDDAIINSTLYAQSLVAAVVDMGSGVLFENCAEVVSVRTDKGAESSSPVALTVLANGHCIHSKHVVVATGGLFTGDANLSGIVRPCWSYLVAMPHPDASSSPITEPAFQDGMPKYSCNFVTWGFTHDWCWSNGAVRISGEDHYSALKPPRSQERCASLARWTQQAYPQVFGAAQGQGQGQDGPPKGVDPSAYSTQYGVYSETPDAVPVVGQVGADSRVCYMLGCNALGQSILSYAATLVPGLLGYRELTAEEKDTFALFDIRRFSLSAGVCDQS